MQHSVTTEALCATRCIHCWETFHILKRLCCEHVSVRTNVEGFAASALGPRRDACSSIVQCLDTTFYDSS